MNYRAFFCIVFTVSLALSSTYATDKETSNHALVANDDPFLSAVHRGKWGFVDWGGDMIIPPQFEGAHNFGDGLGAAKMHGRWGFVDRTGKFVISPQFYDAKMFYGGVALVHAAPQEHGGWTYVDHNGKSVITSHFTEEDCSWTNFPVIVAPGAEVKAKRRVWQSDGRSRKEACFSQKIAVYAEEEPEGDKPWSWYLKGYVNEKGEVIVPARFCRAYPFSEGLAAVQECTYDHAKHKVIRFGKWGFIDSSGKLVLPAIYTDAGDFSNGTAWVILNRQYGTIRKDGRWIIGPWGHRTSDNSDLTSHHGDVKLVTDETGVARPSF